MNSDRKAWQGKERKLLQGRGRLESERTSHEKEYQIY